MKLRLRGNSLRLRLTTTEVSTLRDQGWWQDATEMAATAAPLFAYRVETAAAGQPTGIRFTPGEQTTTLTVILCSADVLSWANDATLVGLYFDEPWGLKVAVEKDFRCLDPARDEDESDNYENPNAATSKHPQCQAE